MMGKTYNRIYSFGLRNSTVHRALAEDTDDLSSIPGIPYCPQALLGVILDCRAWSDP